MIPWIKSKKSIQPIPDAEFYKPLFSPWLGYGEFGPLYKKIKPYTIVSADRCWVLFRIALQAIHLNGEIWECGIYKGGTALLLANIISKKAEEKITLRLFDTFEGMPLTDINNDIHKKGDFSETSYDQIVNLMGNKTFIKFHKGNIPNTFIGLENSRISLAHIDVDIYESIYSCCNFIYDRLCTGGFIIFDDYGHPTCPGARKAVDNFFIDTNIIPIQLPTGQAIIFKSF